jgi:hypothetical protein
MDGISTNVVPLPIKQTGSTPPTRHREWPLLDEVRSFRERALDNGYRLLRVKSSVEDAEKHKKCAKHPVAAGWRRGESRELLSPVTEDALNTGIVCDDLCVIDFDVDDPVVAGKVFKIAEKHLPPRALVRGRADSPRCAFVYRPAGWVPKKTAIGTEKGNKLEILGHRQFLVAHGVHEDGAKYDWQGGDGPDTVPRDELAPVTEEVITEFLDRCVPLLGAKVKLPGLGGQADGLLSNTTGAPFISAKFASFPLDNALGVGIESNKWFDKLRPADMSAVIKACLDAIDNRTSDPYDGWRNTLWAVADAGRLGCPDARQLALDWSRRGKAWTTEAAFDTTWNWYKAKGDGINVGSLIKQAYAAGVDLSPWRSSGSNVIQLPAAAAPTQTSAANDNSPVPAVAGSRMPLKGGPTPRPRRLPCSTRTFSLRWSRVPSPSPKSRTMALSAIWRPTTSICLWTTSPCRLRTGRLWGARSSGANIRNATNARSFFVPAARLPRMSTIFGKGSPSRPRRAMASSADCSGTSGGLSAGATRPSSST